MVKPAPLPPELQRLRRKLEQWELPHLRQHATFLADQLESLSEELSRAEDRAEYWREQVMELHGQLAEMGASMGITTDGDLVVLQQKAAE